MFFRHISLIIICTLIISCNNKEQEIDSNVGIQSGVDLLNTIVSSNDIKNNSFAYQFDEITNEYIRYFSNIGFFGGKIIVNNGYLPFLSYLHDTDLAVLTKDELRILRNIIFAKYGRIFQSKDLTDHFSNFDWYKPQYQNVDDSLTDADRWLIERIQSFEDAQPNNNFQENDLIGTWLGSFPVAAGDYNNIVFRSDNTIRIEYNTMYPQIAWSCTGTYEIKNGFLVVSINSQSIFIGNYFHSGYGSVIGGMEGGDKTAKLIYDSNIIMTFPVSDLKEDYYGYDIGDYKIRRIGSSIRVKSIYD
jgi:hypothetical protein